LLVVIYLQIHRRKTNTAFKKHIPVLLGLLQRLFVIFFAFPFLSKAKWTGNAPEIPAI